MLKQLHQSLKENYVFRFNKTNQTHLFPTFYFVRKKLYKFRAFPDPAWKLSSNVQEICQCRMYSRKLLMMGKGNARNM
jgi:hypothetical protein